MQSILKEIDDISTRAITQAKQQVSMLYQQEGALQKSIEQKNQEINQLDKEIELKKEEVSGLQDKIDAATRIIQEEENRSRNTILTLQADLDAKEEKSNALINLSSKLISEQQQSRGKLLELRDEIKLEIETFKDSIEDKLSKILKDLEVYV